MSSSVATGSFPFAGRRRCLHHIESCPSHRLDAERPVSFSETIVSGLLRRWGQEGVLVTADFSMGAVYGSRPRHRRGRRRGAQCPGGDLILGSHDPAQYFTMMNAIAADRAGGLAPRRACLQRPAAGWYGTIID
jgi:hypothetical protein